MIDQPWVKGPLYCLEEVINDASAGELAFASLAVAPDGTLFATRPLQGQLLAIEDADSDLLPDSERVIADGLDRPNGLAFHDGALYIVAGASIHRFDNNGLETVVDDLPAGGGFWNGGIVIGPDERLYVAIGAPCDACEPEDAGRGAILSMALDGTDRRLVATGLRHPADLAFHAGSLWTIDTARDDLGDMTDLDELNRVEQGAHYGWPYCIGMDNRPDLFPEAFDCDDASVPALSLPTHSTPLGLVSYNTDTFPRFEGALLAILSGNSNQAELRGFAAIVITFNDEGNPAGYEVFIPEQADPTHPADLTFQDVNYQGSGFWPNRPLDIAVNQAGWIYISVSGGRILALRPREPIAS